VRRPSSSRRAGTTSGGARTRCSSHIRSTAQTRPRYVELIPPDGGALGLFERDGYAELVGAKPTEVSGDAVSPAYLYVRVEDVDAAADRIVAAGGRPLSPLATHSWGERAAWFADPDGNLVAIARAAEVLEPA
jgi:predicted enzyme related to lactoylglutathione lyase